MADMSANAGPSDTLYHYTTADGLLGIIDKPKFDTTLTADPSKAFTRALSLRASDVRYLNDSAELRYGANIVARHIDDAMPSITNPRFAALLTGLAANLRTANPLTNNAGPGMRLYATCFCTNGDLLSQWRGYGHNGGGYAIGIPRDVLENHTWSVREGNMPPLNSQWQQARLHSVLYKPEDAESLARQAVQALIDHEGLVTSGPIDGDDSEWATIIVAEVLAMLKHEGFSEEDEVRLILTGDSSERPQFRTGATGLIPYRDLIVNRRDDDNHTPRTITSLIVGPGPNQELRVEAAQRLLTVNGHDPNIVTPSKTPYKG